MHPRGGKLPHSGQATRGLSMWQHYKKTVVGMQVVIWTITAAVYLFFGHQWHMAATFFLVMQFSAVSGAVWAARIGAMVRRDGTVALKARRA